MIILYSDTSAYVPHEGGNQPQDLVSTQDLVNPTNSTHKLYRFSLPAYWVGVHLKSLPRPDDAKEHLNLGLNIRLLNSPSHRAQDQCHNEAAIYYQPEGRTILQETRPALDEERLNANYPLLAKYHVKRL